MLSSGIFAWLELSIVELVRKASFTSQAVLILLLLFSVVSWAIMFAKWNRLSGAATANQRFLRAFRKASGLEAVAIASEQFTAAPLVAVFEYGYGEVERQIKANGNLTNQTALERTLQIGISEQIGKLEQHMNWLATTATISPFVGLFGTVLGIISAFQGLGTAGSTTLRAVAPGISEALVATAMGLGAAIPAAIAYNYFTHQIRELTNRMEDFSLEFLNLAEATFDAPAYSTTRRPEAR